MISALFGVVCLLDAILAGWRFRGYAGWNFLALVIGFFAFEMKTNIIWLVSRSICWGWRYNISTEHVHRHEGNTGALVTRELLIPVVKFR